MPLTSSPVSRPRVDSFDLTTRNLFHWSADNLTLATVRGDQTPTFARSQPGTCRGVTGGLRTPIIGVERWHMFDLDGDGVFETPTLLLERLRTNGAIAPEDLTNGAYSLANVTIGSNQVLAPNGSLTADRVVETTANGNHSLSQDITGGTDNATQSFAVFVKAGERTWCTLVTETKAGTVATSWFNLALGVFGTVAGAHTVRPEAWGRGWYRLFVTFNIGAGGSTPRFHVGLATGDGTNSYTGSTSSGISVWGWHVEVNKSVAGSYAGVATAEESLTWDFDARPQPMTVYAEFIDLGVIIESAGVLQIGSSSGTAPRLTLEAAGGFYRAILFDASSSVSATLGVAPVVGDRIELRAIIASASVDNSLVTLQLGQSINGGTESLTAVSSPLRLPSAWTNPFLLPYIPGGQRSCTAYRRIKVMAGAQSLTTMQSVL